MSTTTCPENGWEQRYGHEPGSNGPLASTFPDRESTTHSQVEAAPIRS